jgi:hypothetical protein
MGKAAGRLAATLAALLAFGGAAPVVLAASPGNDLIGGATPAAIGFSEQLDTTEATTDADDTELNTYCGAPATDASVWYTVEGTDEGVVVDVSGSDYSAGVLVGLQYPDGLEVIACGPWAVSFYAAAGKTYYVLAIDDQEDGAGNGGTLNIEFRGAPPPPTLDVTVNQTGTVNTRTGVATFSGTYTCTDADFIDLYLNATQKVGRFSIQGSGESYDFGTCDGTAHAWSMTFAAYNGKFAGGRAVTVSSTYACGLLECADSYAEQSVMLRGAK